MGFVTLAATGERLDSTRTAADGSFRFAVGPGSWRVRVESPGFAPWSRDQAVAGDHLSVRLDPAVQLLVTVLDPRGEPVAGAEVVVRERHEVVPENVGARKETDPEGHALIEVLSPGAWLVVVRHRDHAVHEAPLEIPSGRYRLEKEVRLQSGTSLVGTVKSEAGEPLADARVRVESPYRNAFLVEEVRADTAGRYETARVFSRGETLELVATAPGHAEVTTFVGIQPADAAAGERRVDFTLAAGGRRILGRAVVEDAGLASATVRIAAFDPVGSSPDDVLFAIQSAPKAPWLWQEVARTDATGRFEVQDLSTEPQYVLLIASRECSARMVWVPPGAGGEATDLGEITLERWGGLFGRAVLADGTPAEGEVLGLYKLNRVYVTEAQPLGAWRPDSWFGHYVARTREDGFFRFETLAPGTYAFVSGPAGSFEVASGRATGPVEVVVERPATEPKLELSGVVRDPAGQPLFRVFVRAYVTNAGAETPRLVATALVRDEGAFSLRFSPGSRTTLVFTDFGGLHESREVDVSPQGSASPLEIVLQPRPQRLPPIVGLVLEPTGAPLAGGIVRRYPPEDSLCNCLSFQTKTDATGSFRFENLTEGPNRLVATDPRFESASAYPCLPGQSVLLELGGR